jgi:hypothetical protein
MFVLSFALTDVYGETEEELTEVDEFDEIPSAQGSYNVLFIIILKAFCRVLYAVVIITYRRSSRPRRKYDFGS